MKCKLLYRASGKTFTNANFRSKSHNIPHTIVIMRSEAGKILGGYADQTWDASGQYKISSKVFLFDLKEKKQYLPSNPQVGTMYCSGSGPTFGTNFDFIIGEDAQTIAMGSPFLIQNALHGQSSGKKTVCYRFAPTTFVEKGQNPMLSGVQSYLQQPGNVDCVEVFQLEYPGIEEIGQYVAPNQFGQFQFENLGFNPAFNLGGQGLNPGFNFGGQGFNPAGNDDEDYPIEGEEGEAE